MSVRQAIETVCASHADRKARWKAMKSIKWVLRSPAGQYAYLGERLQMLLTSDLNQALVFDGRDNEMMKAEFYSIILKIPMTPELISCAV